MVQESDWVARGPHQSHHLMERLSKRGHEVRVIDFEILWRNKKRRGLIAKRETFKNVHKAIEEGDITVIRPSIIKVPILDYLSLLYTHHKEIKRQIREFRPDIIVGFGILNANIAIHLAKKNRIPFAYYIIDELHRLVPQRAFRNLARYIESKNMKNADKVLSINEGLREYTIQMGAQKDRTEVIRAGVDLERFASTNGKSIREKYGLNDDDIVLFFMGWLYDFSGLKEVAMELAKVENDNAKLLIVGKGDLWNILQDIREKYGLEKKIIIVDWVQYNEVPEYLAASNICILPAYKNDVMRNIVPIKMYEYMAAGKPVIATENHGIKSEFGNNNGVIYIDKPEDALQKAVKLVETKSMDKEGQAAKKFVEKCNWDLITNIFERTLERI